MVNYGLKNKVALITGANNPQGIGAATAFAFARAMGFDTLIMGMRETDALRRLMNIPESETVMAVIALGYRDAEPNRPERRNLDEILKFF